MLQLDPAERPSASECLEHAYFRMPPAPMAAPEFAQVTAGIYSSHEHTVKGKRRAIEDAGAPFAVTPQHGFCSGQCVRDELDRYWHAPRRFARCIAAARSSGECRTPPADAGARADKDTPPGPLPVPAHVAAARRVRQRDVHGASASQHAGVAGEVPGLDPALAPAAAAAAAAAAAPVASVGTAATAAAASAPAAPHVELQGGHGARPGPQLQHAAAPPHHGSGYVTHSGPGRPLAMPPAGPPAAQQYQTYSGPTYEASYASTRGPADYGAHMTVHHPHPGMHAPPAGYGGHAAPYGHATLYAPRPGPALPGYRPFPPERGPAPPPPYADPRQARAPHAYM